MKLWQSARESQLVTKITRSKPVKKNIRISNDELLDVRICERGRRKGEVTCYIHKGKYEGTTFTITKIEKGDQPAQFQSYEELIETLNNERPDWSLFYGKVDCTLNTIWYGFKTIKPRTPKVGCWDVYFTNALTEEHYSTQGNVHKNTTWADFFNWIVEDIEEMDVGKLSDMRFEEMCYVGIDEYFED